MPSNLARVGLPALLAALLLWLLLSGQVSLYIHDRTLWLVALSVPLLAAMAVACARGASGTRTDRLAVAAIALPLIAGVLVPARPLGAVAVQDQSFSDLPNALLGVATPALELEANSWDLVQLAVLRARDPRAPGLDGSRASLLGFVVRKGDLPAGQFLVARFVMRHCTADAFALSFPVRYDGAGELTSDSWVSVEGRIRYVGPAGAEVPVVEAEQVRVIPQPSRPYLYL